MSNNSKEYFLNVAAGIIGSTHDHDKIFEIIGKVQQDAALVERNRIIDYLVSNKICPAVKNVCETPGFMESCCFCCWSMVLDKEKEAKNE